MQRMSAVAGLPVVDLPGPLSNQDVISESALVENPPAARPGSLTVRVQATRARQASQVLRANLNLKKPWSFGSRFRET